MHYVIELLVVMLLVVCPSLRFPWKLLRARGYAVRAMVWDHKIWCEMPRERVWILAVHRRFGHTQAADWICEQVRAAHKRRRMSDPKAVFDIVNVDDAEETVRRARTKVF
jgi:hypothetical protein